MRFELVILAHLAASVSGLTIAEGGSKLVHAREPPVPSGEPSSSSTSGGSIGDECAGSPGYTYSPGDWQKLRDPTSDSGLVQKSCMDEDPGSGRGSYIYFLDPGCLVIDDSKYCMSMSRPYHVAAKEGESISFVNIYAMFNGDDHDPQVRPGCRLPVKWPSAWRDLVFRDNCLSDSTGEWKECCESMWVEDEVVDNPYL
ncbi:hypothetical protein N7463_004652 [Penicillium fimorum]|uniref:Uncharacterized protein n=1 Tax=Penicillium fimorum TaxID=1882269 RepID=A0A9W9Y4T1_9EURO|nr:hypothetical protein N7463_004652 [Penicillium fimorum]